MENYQHIGACVIVRNEVGEILLGRRKNSYKPGLYGAPGGRLELAEPIEACARRELQEETGIVANKLRFVGVVRDDQTEYDFIHFVYAYDNCKDKPELVEKDKCEGWEWISPDQLPPDMLRGHKAAIELVLDHNSNLIDLNTPED